jgi:hypothetical protein
MASRPIVSIREILFPTDLSPESDRAFGTYGSWHRFAAAVTLNGRNPRPPPPVGSPMDARSGTMPRRSPECPAASHA